MENNEMSQDSTNMSPRDAYNHWSLDIGVGVNKPTRQFTKGTFVNTPSFFQADLGIRYMVNNKFGFNLDLGYNSIKSDKRAALQFDSRYFRTGLEGVVNAGEIMGFREWTKSFNILLHGGLGAFRLSTENGLVPDDSEWGSFATFGITPQIRLSDRIALFGDLSIIGNIDQEITWDGATVIPSQESRGFQSAMYNASIGLNIYLGSKDKHADWYTDPKDDRLDNLEKEVNKLITDLADDDQDGVPNYLDRDNTTESGVAVDSKGRAIDINKNGIPDELESSLEARYATKADLDALARDGKNAGDVMKTLINEGYINVYFKFASDKPETYSLGALSNIVAYMKNNPSQSATLTGYADELGTESFNKSLSERRAERVKEVMIAAGISESRITTTGGGVDSSVEKGSSAARQTVRRVTFRVN